MTMYERGGPGALGLSGVEIARLGPRSTCLPDAAAVCSRKHKVLWAPTCPDILQAGSACCRPVLVAFGKSGLDEAVLVKDSGKHRKKNVTW
jgi:hypothetical protein